MNRIRGLYFLFFLTCIAGCSSYDLRNIYYYEYCYNNPFDIRSLELKGDTVIISSLYSNRMLLEIYSNKNEKLLKEFILSSDTSVVMNGFINYKFFDTLLQNSYKRIGDSFEIYRMLVRNKYSTDFADTLFYKTTCKINDVKKYGHFNYFDCDCKYYRTHRRQVQHLTGSQIISLLDTSEIWELRWEGKFWFEPISRISLKMISTQNLLYADNYHDTSSICNSFNRKSFNKNYKKLYRKYMNAQ